MKSWPKVKLGQIQVGSNIAQNHLTKSEIRSSLNRLENCSESLI